MPYYKESSEVLKQYDFMNLRAVLIIAYPIYSSIMPYLYKDERVKMYFIVYLFVYMCQDDEFI